MEKIKGYTYCYDCNNIFNDIAKDWHCPECNSERLQMGIAEALIDYILNAEEDQQTAIGQGGSMDNYDVKVKECDTCFSMYHDLNITIDKVHDLEQDNAKLKAQAENTRLGLEKLGETITGPSHYLGHQEGEFCIFRVDGEGVASAETLAGSLDQVVLMEVE